MAYVFDKTGVYQIAEECSERRFTSLTFGYQLASAN